MNRTRLSLSIVGVIAVAVIAVIVSTTGSSARKGPAVAGNSALSIQQTSLGKTLTDANGRTLYLFAGDKRNVAHSPPQVEHSGRHLRPASSRRRPAARWRATSARSEALLAPLR